jgi:hypothetical protein
MGSQFAGQKRRFGMKKALKAKIRAIINRSLNG